MNQKQISQNEPMGNVSPENSLKPTAGFNYENLELSLEQMLRAGVHFGHKKSRWNPKMQPYIFAVRNNIHIIDLEKSQELLRTALQFIENISEERRQNIVCGYQAPGKTPCERNCGVG